MAGDGGADGVGVRHVEGGPVEPGGLAPGGVEDGEQVPPEHPARAGDQDGAHARAARALSGSHQARLSRYQAMVSARPSAKETCGS
ncbi:hypothetical protein GCM10025734_37880 [Kitasatospora paranensis]